MTKTLQQSAPLTCGQRENKRNKDGQPENKGNKRAAGQPESKGNKDGQPDAVLKD